MKGDFSRFSFNPRRHYSRVLLQQGRVLSDADWNEQAEILAHRQATMMRDLIGRAGVPHDQAGFAIRAHGGLCFDGKTNCFEVHDIDRQQYPGDGYTVEGWIRIQGERHAATIVSRMDRDPSDRDPGGFRFGLTQDGRIRFERLEVRDETIVEIDEIGIDEEGRLHEDDIVIDVEHIAPRRIVGRQTLPVDRFCHVAAVCEEGRLRLFIHGELDHESRARRGVPFASSPMLIGCERGRGGTRNHFAGVIDRLRMWPRALAPSEIRTAMRTDLHAHVDADCRWLLNQAAAHDTNGSPDGDQRAVPANAPTHAKPEIWIGAGRCYIDGLLCENDDDVLYQAQADCPGLALPDHTAHNGSYLAYLDVWERVISAIEDPDIREPALGGPDTAVRLRTVAQVRLLPLTEGAEPRVPPCPPSGLMRARRTPGYSGLDNLLYRVEIHDSGYAAGTPMPRDGEADEAFKVIRADAATVTIALPASDRHVWRAGQSVEVAHPGRHATGTTTVAVVSSGPTRGELSLRLDPMPDMDGDPTEWRLRPIATFKWSRDNGASAFPVSIDASGTTLQVSNADQAAGMLAPSDWVEVVDDDMMLHGRIAPLCQIADIDDGDPSVLEVVLTTPSSDIFNRPHEQRMQAHPLLRRWDGIASGGAATLGTKLVGAAGSHAPQESVTTLAGGIRLEFSPGSYATGDYWLVPVREDPEWPADQSGEPAPPHGIRHHHAELALLSFVGNRIFVEDLRRMFAPLVDATRPAPPPPIPADPVPAGFGILGPSARSPSGWHYTGARLALSVPEPTWSLADLHLPEAGPVMAAALQDRIFCLRHTGEFWALDPKRIQEEAWTLCRPLGDAALAGAAIAAFDGKLHVVGGEDADGNASTRHRCFDPAADAWRELAPLPTPRTGLTAVALGGLLYAIGGLAHREREVSDAVESYLPSEDIWVRRPVLPRPVGYPAAGTYGGRLYVFGGIHKHLLGLEHHITNDINVFSPSGDYWTSMPPLPAARSAASVAAAEDRFYLIGGTLHDQSMAPVEVLQPSTGQWLEAPQSKHWRTDGAVAMLDGVIHLLGGVTATGPTAAIETCLVEHVFHVHRKLAPAAASQRGVP